MDVRPEDETFLFDRCELPVVTRSAVVRAQQEALAVERPSPAALLGYVDGAGRALDERHVGAKLKPRPPARGRERVAGGTKHHLAVRVLLVRVDPAAVKPAAVQRALVV